MRPDQAQIQVQTAVHRQNIGQPAKALDQWKLKTECDLNTKEQELKRLSLQRSHIQDEVFMTQSEKDKVKVQLEHVQGDTKSVEQALEEKEERRQILEEAVKSLGRSMPLIHVAFKPVEMMKESVEHSLSGLRQDLEERDRKSKGDQDQIRDAIKLKMKELESKKTEKMEMEQKLVEMSGTLASNIQSVEAQAQKKSELFDRKMALEANLKELSNGVEAVKVRVDEIKSNIKTMRIQMSQRTEQCENQIKQKDEETNSLKDFLSNAEAEKMKLEQTLEEKKKILAEGLAELNKLNHTYDGLKVSSMAASKTIEAELRKLSEKQDHLRKEVEVATEKNQESKEKVSAMAQERAGLESKLQSQIEEIKMLQEEIDNLTTYYDELPGARKDLEVAQLKIQSLRSVQARFYGQEKENKMLKEKKAKLEEELESEQAQCAASYDDEQELNRKSLEIKSLEEQWKQKSRELKEKLAKRAMLLDLEKVLETKNEELKDLKEQHIQKYNDQVIQIKASSDKNNAKKVELEKKLEKLSKDLNALRNQTDSAEEIIDPHRSTDEESPRPSHPRLKKTLTTDSNSSASSDWLSSFQKSRAKKTLPTKGSLSTLFDSESES